MISGVNVLDKQPQPSNVPGRSRRRRVAVAGGGTAGHVTSALAIIAAYQAIFDADVCFIGCQGGFETKLVPAGGFELEIIPGAPYARQNLIGKLRALVALVLGTLAARQLLKAKQTELVIGVGGYASLGTVLAARMLGIHTVIYEANVFPGLANRLIGRLSDRIFVGWDQASTSFPISKTIVTGNPVRPDLAARSNEPHNKGRRQGPRRVLVTGGSQGSPFLNDKVPALLARVLELGVPVAVRHQTGDGAAERVRRDYQRLGIEAHVEPFIQDIAEAYCQAELVITAAGALTLAELAMFGIPSILVPQDAAARGHQIANAKVYAERAGGTWVSERGWDSESVAVKIASTLSDVDALSEQARRLREMARPNAARKLVEECEALLAGRSPC